MEYDSLKDLQLALSKKLDEGRKIKPLYMLIKVDVDSGIVYDQDQAEKYAENHCNSLEYALCDWYYPDEQQYPYIAK